MSNPMVVRLREEIKLLRANGIGLALHSNVIPDALLNRLEGSRAVIIMVPEGFLMDDGVFDAVALGIITAALIEEDLGEVTVSKYNDFYWRVTAYPVTPKSEAK